MTLASGPVLGSAATGGSGLPADQTAHASPELAAAALSLPRGSVWAAQVGAVRSADFVLVIAGMPFEIAGAPPAGEGGTLMVRVVDDTGLPVFEVLANEAPHAQNVALRSLLAHLLHRALASDAAWPASAAVLEAASPSSRDLAAALQHGAHDRLADRILALAHDHGVPIQHDPALAAALTQLELDREIPPQLFAAVAEVIGFLYRMKPGR